MKTYVKKIIAETRRKKRSAGVIVVKNIDGEWKYLALKLYGKYDVTKGRVEVGESLLDAALRETTEEADITRLDFAWGQQYIKVKHITLFVAATMQEAAVRKNADGVYEHHGHEWVSYDKMLLNVHPYMVPAINWANNIINSS